MLLLYSLLKVPCSTETIIKFVPSIYLEDLTPNASRFYTCPSLWIASPLLIVGPLNGDKHIAAAGPGCKKPWLALGANYPSSLHKWLQKMLTHCISGAEGSLNGYLLAKYPDSGLLAYKYPSLVSRLLCSGMWRLRLCMRREPGIFSHMRTLKCWKGVERP